MAPIFAIAIIGATRRITMRRKTQNEITKARIHVSEGYAKGELAKEILLMISAGLAVPAASIMNVHRN
jgi:hypothetical protein